MTQEIPTYPALGEVFELILDGDTPENSPIGMVHRYSYISSPEKWEHVGKRINGLQARHFKLVQFYFCNSNNDVTSKLQNCGNIPEGQWLEAFRATYPNPDNNGDIGIYDRSWIDQDGYACYPCIDSNGSPCFSSGHWSFDDYLWKCRWLVEAWSLIPHSV